MTTSGAIILGTHLAALSAGWQGSLSLATMQAMLGEAESLNYRVITLPLSETVLADGAARLRTRERSTRLWTYCALPSAMHLPQRPEHARAWLGRALAWTEAVGASVLAGALAWSPGMLAPVRSPAEDRALAAEVLRDVAVEAQQRKITLALEPANRYETSLCNTLAQGAALVETIDMPNVRLLANSFHMHFEEANVAAALRAGHPHLIGLHLAENTGGRLGSGAVAWESIWQTLGADGFGGALIVTPWSAEAAEALRLAGAHSAASDALRFLRAGVRAMQPPASRLPAPTEAKPKRKRTATKSYRR